MDTSSMLQAGALTIAGLLVSALCWGLKKGADYLSQATKNSALANFYGRLDALAEKVVKDVYQATVSGLQANGNWNSETQATAKAQAVAKLKSYLGMEGLHMLEFLAGAAGDKANLDEFLGTFVEAAVVDAKAPSAASATVATLTAAAASASAVLSAKLAPGAPAAAPPAVNPT